MEEVLDLDLSFDLHLDAMLHGKTCDAAVDSSAVHLWINDILKPIMPVGKRRSYYVLKQICSF